MRKPWAEVKGKTIVVGDQGSNSFQLSVWLQSLHLHLGQITQCGLPTTVCMTNHCDRAGLQPTQLHTYARGQTKTNFTVCGHKRAHFFLITALEIVTGTSTSKVVSFKAQHVFLYCVLFFDVAGLAGNKLQIANPCNNNRLIVKQHSQTMANGVSIQYDHWQMPQLKAVPSPFFFSFCLIMLSFVQPTEAAQTEMQGGNRGQANNRGSQTPNSSLRGALILLSPRASLGIRATREWLTLCYKLAASTQKSFSPCCRPATTGQTW